MATVTSGYGLGTTKGRYWCYRGAICYARLLILILSWSVCAVVVSFALWAVS